MVSIPPWAFLFMLLPSSSLDPIIRATIIHAMKHGGVDILAEQPVIAFENVT